MLCFTIHCQWGRKQLPLSLGISSPRRRWYEPLRLATCAKIGKDRACGSGDMLAADRQTNTHTHKRAHYNTSPPLQQLCETVTACRRCSLKGWNWNGWNLHVVALLTACQFLAQQFVRKLRPLRAVRSRCAACGLRRRWRTGQWLAGRSTDVRRRRRRWRRCRSRLRRRRHWR